MKDHRDIGSRAAIDEGLKEYRSTVRSKEGIHPEIDVAEFERERESNVLRREDLEKDIETFTERNLGKLIPLLLEQGTDFNTLIDRLGITNEDIGNLGADLFINVVDGQKKIFRSVEDNPEGYEITENDHRVSANDLLALAYLKRNIRVDTLPATARREGSPARRLFYKPANRYLASNDFGMRIWNEEEQRLVDGDVTDAAGMVRTIATEFRRLGDNLQYIPGTNFNEVYNALAGEAHDEVAAAVATEVGQLSDEEVVRQFNRLNGWHYEEYNDYMRESVRNGLAQERLKARVSPVAHKQVTEKALEALENPANRDLIFHGIPARKAFNQARYKSTLLLKDAGLAKGDAVDGYHDLERDPNKYLGRLFQRPTQEEMGGATLPFVFFGKQERPVLVGERNQADALAREVLDGLKEALVGKIVRDDEGLKPYRCGRGPNSPYHYKDYELFDLVETVGRENVEAVLDRDDRNISEQVKASRYLRHCLGTRKLEPEALKKQLKEAKKLTESGMWGYLADREKVAIEQEHGPLPEEVWRSDAWMEYVHPRRARQLFGEGKRMYWLAQKCYQLTPGRAETDRFYREHSYTNWKVYELSEAGIPEEKLREHLEKNIKFIASFLSLKKEDDPLRQGAEAGDSPVTLEVMIRALDTGKDLRSALFASDKRAFFEDVARGEDPRDPKDLVAEWPREWQAAATEEEIDIAHEYADDYIKSGPTAFTKYVAWRASEEGQGWNEVFGAEAKTKGDLDFRISMSIQTPEVRGWYKEGAEYVGAPVMQDYLLRFNALRDTEGRFGNLHDTLFWIPNVKNLEVADAKQVLKSIQTMDDNQEFIQLVPRYRKQDDPFTAREGGITSIRELKKRVIAIESNLDFSSLPGEVVEITSAPGFNASALKDLQREARFRDLVEGKLDKEQPFEPRTRLFAGRDLTEALKEGLGSQKLKIRGTAQDPKGLFHEINKLIKDRKVGDRRMQVVDLFDQVPPDLEETVIKLLREQRVDVGPTVEATVHAKSDPEGWVCGNYTDCCMPFGDYKNTDYMFNKGTQYFTVKYNGRIVAQSVIVDGVNNNDNKDVVLLDNIEVANNYKNLSPLLARVYQTFWTEYTDRPVKVGAGYADLIPPGGKLEANIYSPKRPIAYTDAGGDRIYDMPKMKGVESLEKQVTFANLTERDVDLIAKMEKEAYPEEGLVMGKDHISQVLQAQRALEVPGAASSFIVRQGKEPAGYLLVLPEESEMTGERVAHIHDMAVLPKFRGFTVAMKMMERVLDVAEGYGVAIEAEARAKTTYALLMNTRVKTWLKSKGFEVTRSEKLAEYMGGEDFYFVRIENVKGTTEE